MGNNGFSHFSRLGRSTSPAPNAGESQPELNVEQEQQGTFLGRSATSYDPENTYLTSLITSQAANLRASTSATATSPIVQYLPATENLADPFLEETSASQPITQSSATSGPPAMNPPEDPFAALVAYELTSFEEEQQQFYGSLGTFDDLINAYLPEGLEITSQPSGQTALAPVMDSSVIYSQGADSPSQGQPTAATEVAIKTVIKISEQKSHVSGASSQEESQKEPQEKPLQQPVQLKFPDSRAALSRPQMMRKVKTRTGKERPSDKYLLRTNSVYRPYVCGYPNCYMTYKSSGHLREHVFEHIGVSEYRCTYPECGPDKYFCSNSALRRHIIRAHIQKQRWNCVVCHRIFKSLETLRTHMIKEHYVPPKQ